MADNVNHPSHYTTGSIECIDAIRASMTDAEFKGYLKGNAMKYLWRYQLKGNPREDLEKAVWYIRKLIEMEPSFKSDVEREFIFSDMRPMEVNPKDYVVRIVPC